MSKPHAQDAYPPIEDYGLIRACHSAALVGSRGSLDWLCLPRFDSPSVFARILDLERGGAWSIHPTARFRAEHRYLRNTNVLGTVFTGERGKVRLLDFMFVSPEVVRGGRESPDTAVRIVEGVDGETEMESVCWSRPGYAKTPPGLPVRGKEASFGRCTLNTPVNWRPDDTGCVVSCRKTVRKGETVVFVLRYGDVDETILPAALTGGPKCREDPLSRTGSIDRTSFNGTYASGSGTASHGWARKRSVR